MCIHIFPHISLSTYKHICIYAYIYIYIYISQRSARVRASRGRQAVAMQTSNSLCKLINA